MGPISRSIIFQLDHIFVGCCPLNVFWPHGVLILTLFFVRFFCFEKCEFFRFLPRYIRVGTVTVVCNGPFHWFNFSTCIIKFSMKKLLQERKTRFTPQNLNLPWFVLIVFFKWTYFEYLVWCDSDLMLGVWSSSTVTLSCLKSRSLFTMTAKTCWYTR